MAKNPTRGSTTPRKPRAGRATMSAPRLVARRTPDTSAIAVRAYELFVAGGCVHGNDVDHWLRAERELTDRLLTSAA